MAGNLIVTVKFLAMNQKENKERGENNEENNSIKPDPETLHTTDPQEHMKGPVSSSLEKLGESFDSDESKEEAEEKRDGHM